MFAYSGVGLGIYSGAGSSTQGLGIWMNNGSPYEAIRILSGGNVGIGTTSPAAKLDIVGASSGLALSFGTTVPNNPLFINTYGGWSGIGMDVSTAGLRLVGEYQTNNPVVDMGYYTSATVQHANWTSVMMVRQGGNVGIGTTNPAYKLDVNGTGRFSSNLLVTRSQPDITINGSSTSQYERLVFQEAGVEKSIIQYVNSAFSTVSRRNKLEIANGDIHFITQGIFTSPDVVFTSNGRVGIGLTNPSQRLHVSGAIAQTLGSATTTHFVGVTGSLTTNTVVASVDVATQPAYAVFFDYVVYDDTDPPTNARAGSIMTVNNNSTSRYTDTSTSDIGDTTPVDFSTSISGNNLLLTANIASGTWFVNLNYRRF
jgi:hypothetical protein